MGTHKVDVMYGHVLEAYDCGDYYEIKFEVCYGRYPSVRCEILIRKFPKTTDNTYPVSRPKEKKDSEFPEFIAWIFER